MIPERAQNEVTSNIQGETVAMGLAADAAEHFMSIFTDMYANAILAMIREYCTNAWDAHVAAGITRPIELSLPTPLRPVLKIQDWGLGLDGEEIRAIYSQYGASTKRGTNSATGMLGIGCKSALTYTDQFTVVGIKDGKRIVVSVSRSASGGGEMVIVDQGETDEPNGVTVSIPTRPDDEWKFRTEAEIFFRVWEPGTILVNGEAPDPLDGVAIGDDFMLTTLGHDTHTAAERLRIVMGKVSYPVPATYPSSVLDNLPKRTRLFARVPIGTVAFAPSREALMDHPATRAALDQTLAKFATELSDAAEREVASADSRPAAAKRLGELRRTAGADNLPAVKWNGEVIPARIKLESREAWLNRGYTSRYHKASERARIASIDFDKAVNAVWVLGFTNKSFTMPMRAKLERYMSEEMGIEDARAQEVILQDGLDIPSQEWLDGAVKSVTWEEVRAWKDPNRPLSAGGTGAGKFAGTYVTINPAGVRKECFPAADIGKDDDGEDDELPIYYYDMGKHYPQLSEAVEFLGGDYWLVCMPEVRANKFRKLFPQAKPIGEAATKAAERWIKKLTAKQRKVIVHDRTNATHMTTATAFRLLDHRKVKDRELSALARQAEEAGDGDLLRQYERALRLTAHKDVFESEIEKQNEVVAEVTARYPLIFNRNSYYVLNGASPKMAAHMVHYVNAVYAAE